MPPILALKLISSAPSNGALPDCRPMPPAEPRIGQQVVLAALRGYKLIFSPLYAGSCRFLPSCSDYAAQAVTEFGVLRGLLMAARRLARCHPLATAGFDPVPPRSPRV